MTRERRMTGWLRDDPKAVILSEAKDLRAWSDIPVGNKKIDKKSRLWYNVMRESAKKYSGA